MRAGAAWPTFAPGSPAKHTEVHSMQAESRLDNPRWELATAIVIAVVSLSTALAVWWTGTVASNSADLNRQGMIDAIKVQAGTNESWRKAYEEAAYAARYAISAAEAQALSESDDAASRARGENLRTYLLPSLQLLAAPLASDPTYALPDGTYDIQRRFDDLQAGSELSGLDPAVSFDSADRLAAQQRWLVVGSVCLAISLFWLALAQISHARRRLISFLVGLGFFGASLVWFLIVGLVFALLGGGAL
jgi:hypothetical protein